MTNENEEKAREIANNCSTEIVGAEVSDETYITTEPDCYTAAMKMAEWKDEQFAKEKQSLIDKACEWLKENASKHIHGNYAFLKGLMLEEFQQAMNVFVMLSIIR